MLFMAHFAEKCTILLENVKIISAASNETQVCVLCVGVFCVCVGV